jgi:competence ComEA-like helix-hairpin-helix protein
MFALLQRGVGSFGNGRVIRRSSVIALIVAFTALSANAKKHPPDHPLDLNAATLEQLEQLPDVGPGIANAIIEFREKSGPFQRVEDLLAIRGITKQRLEKIRPYVVVVIPTKTTNRR